MAESEPYSKSSAGEDVKAPNVFARVKEEIEAVIHNDKHRRHHETHGLRDDIDENSPMGDVKAPNVFERAKEEIEAIVEAVHLKKEHKSPDSYPHAGTRDSATKDSLKSMKPDSHSECSKTPNLVETLMHKPHHHKETHGMSNDFDENTPVSELKAPNVFERAKEEIEALVEAIHPRKDSVNAVSSPKHEGGLSSSIGRGLEKFCSPRSHNKD